MDRARKGKNVMVQPRTKEQHASVEVIDPIWQRVRLEAEEIERREPALATFAYATILNHDRVEDAIIHRIASRLDHWDVTGELLRIAFEDALDYDPAIADAMRADIVAVVDRDPACHRYVEPILYFKGFQALQTHRFAHALLSMGRKDFAFYLQSRSSQIYQVDIHPAVKIGRGIMLDHATGLVVGETATIADEVSILQGVTLGGTGKEEGDRHPKIHHGVLIGAGAKILGNIDVGCCSRVAAGSVVLKSVPAHTTVAGVPARVIGQAGSEEPALCMDQMLADRDGESG